MFYLRWEARRLDPVSVPGYQYGLVPGREHCVVYLGKTRTLLSRCLSVPMQVYKWVPANLMLGVTFDFGSKGVFIDDF